MLQHFVAELGVAVLDLRSRRVRAIGQQALAVALHAKTRAEAQTALCHRLAGVVEHRRARVLEVGIAPAGPWQTVVLAVDRTTFRLQRVRIEGVPVLLMRLQALRALAGVADGPHAPVELAGDVLDHRLIVVHLDVLGELGTEAQLLGKQIHDGVIGLRLEDRVDHLRAPLQTAVGRRY